MADGKGLTGTPWQDSDIAFPEPGVEGTVALERGGFDLGDGSEKETPNSMSGLPLLPVHIDVKDGPAPGSTAEVFPGVTSPTEGAGNMKIG